jgi:hypothetical protein
MRCRGIPHFKRNAVPLVLIRVRPAKPVQAGEPSFAVPLSGLSEKRGKALGSEAPEPSQE